MANKELFEQALKHVFTDTELYVKALASYSTVENAGQQGYFDRVIDKEPEKFFIVAFQHFYQAAGYDGFGMGGEFQEWKVEARRIVTRLQEKGLPLTIENGNHAWYKTGPFEDEKRKKALAKNLKARVKRKPWRC